MNKSELLEKGRAVLNDKYKTDESTEEFANEVAKRYKAIYKTEPPEDLSDNILHDKVLLIMNDILMEESGVPQEVYGRFVYINGTNTKVIRQAIPLTEEVMNRTNYRHWMTLDPRCSWNSLSFEMSNDDTPETIFMEPSALAYRFQSQLFPYAIPDILKDANKTMGKYIEAVIDLQNIIFKMHGDIALDDEMVMPDYIAEYKLYPINVLKGFDAKDAITWTDHAIDYYTAKLKEYKEFSKKLEDKQKNHDWSMTILKQAEEELNNLSDEEFIKRHEVAEEKLKKED